MVPEPYSGRLAALRKKMEENGLDAFLVSVPENRYYLSGFEATDLQLTESSGILLVGFDRQVILTDFRYQEEAGRQARGYDLVVYKETWDPELKGIFRNWNVRRLGIEANYLTVQRYRQLKEILQDVHARGEVVPTEGMVEDLRMVKDPDEVERIRESLRLTEQVFDWIWTKIKPGMSEKGLAWMIEAGIRESGAESVSFPPIVASGPNGALPHAVPTDRRLTESDAVVLDLGARLRLYCSDMTRTWLGPRVSDELKRIYGIVRTAQQAAMEAICPGIDSHEVDRIARGIIEEAGYGEKFGHGLGHGVGLAVHEKPGYGKKNSVVLQENMVLTVEPGIYVPGLGGVRLENMVRVTSDGCENLSRDAWFLPV